MAEKQIFAAFFREESIDMLGLEGDEPVQESLDISGRKKDTVPVFMASDPAEELKMKSYWRKLRVFFRTGKGGGIVSDAAENGVFPALLAPFRQSGILQSGYPQWITDRETESRGGFAGMTDLPVSDLLAQLVAQIAPGAGEARILKDNLPRLEKIIRDKLSFADISYQAGPVFAEALQDLESQLAVKGEEGKAFTQDLNRLKERLPKSGLLLPYFRNVPFHMLSAFISTWRIREKKEMEEEIARLVARLSDILAVEKEKDPESKSAGHLHDSLDFADTFLNFDELSAVLPSGEEDAMPEERLHRIEKILSTLKEAHQSLFATAADLVVGATVRNSYDLEWDQCFSGSIIHRAEDTDTCSQAIRVFDQRMKEAARVFGAVRLATLEVENRYQPEVHADFFAHFDWRSFTETELAVCPSVVLLTDSFSLVHDELNAFSGLLASNRPIRVLALKREIQMNGGEASAPLSEPVVFRQEPGALALAHRNTFVLQATPVDPAGILNGFRDGFATHSPALFHLYAPASAGQTREERFLKVSAAVEGREFPGFVYNEAAGPKWGSRFDLTSNPHPLEDWPEYDLVFRDRNGEESKMSLRFTFADFAAQDEHFTGQFHLVPSAYWSDELVPLHEYLTLSAETRFSVIPYIWVVDAGNTLQKAAVSWQLVLTCLERLEFWHFLQENAGIHSYHVEQATEKLRQEIEAAFSAKITQIEKDHAAALVKIQEETARAAMERLAATLLDMDAGLDIPAAVTAPVSAPVSVPVKESQPVPAEAVKPAPKPEEPEPEEILTLGEAWIDTPLCTSCNECIDTNKRIFQYNADKQAFVANPKGGPFADIVKAAEKCPVRIIHPGAPLDPNEPGLQELIKRAEPFN